MQPLLDEAAARAGRFLDSLDRRPVVPSPGALARLAELGGPLPEHPADPSAVLARLDDLGTPAAVASAGGRYFGFVTGGALPATVAAAWLAAAWDQNSGLSVGAPGTAALEAIALDWLVDLLGLPSGTGAGFVTGATMANFSGLAAARHAILARNGWDVGARGLFGAPPITVVAGDEAHVSLLKALSLLGLGRERVLRVPVDDQGRIRPDALPPLDGSTILCLQAGNVNTGAFDPAEALVARGREAGAWVHVDGAFGLWALASPRLAALAAGVAEADSIATDAHKWLNVPYDSGLVFVRRPEHLEAAMATSAAYLVREDARQPDAYTPELSRRARGVEVWAALASLGRSGVAELVDRCCRLATRFADGFRAAGFEVLNDVVLNQVLVAFGDDQTTRRVVARVQAGGVCWAGGTLWRGRAAMRVSVSSWRTREADVDRSLAAIAAAAREG